MSGGLEEIVLLGLICPWHSLFNMIGAKEKREIIDKATVGSNAPPFLLPVWCYWFRNLRYIKITKANF